MKNIFPFILFTVIILASCDKRNDITNTTDQVEQTSDLVISSSFNWSSSLKGELTVSFNNPNNVSLEREYLHLLNSDFDLVERRQIADSTAIFDINLPKDAQYYLYFPITQDKIEITTTGAITMQLGEASKSTLKQTKSDNDIISCTTCDSPIINPGIEEPYIRDNDWGLFHEDDVPGWETTASDGMIELWGDGFLGSYAQEGRQIMELNANMVSALYQELCLEPGSTIRWSVNHKGRAGVDVADVRIGASVETAEVVAVMSDGKNEWGFYEGTYQVPEDQETTFFVFNSVSASGGSLSVGNLLDNFEISCDFDGDGIADDDDDDPDNADIAYVSHFPTSGKQIVAFEDLWPDMGDYDFNDLVLAQQVTIYKDNNFKPLYADFTISIDAIGAGFHNGFGLVFYDNDKNPIGADMINDVVGDASLDPEVTNGLIVSNDVYETIDTYYQNNGVGPTSVPDTVKFTVSFNENAQEFLPELYLFRTANRELEVHRSEFSPTDVADDAFFSQGDNDGNYLTENGLPWGLEIYTESIFRNPIEKIDILLAYPQFEEWATSAGENNSTWYLNPIEDKVIDLPEE